jgi:hypothetical protein
MVALRSPAATRRCSSASFSSEGDRFRPTISAALPDDCNAFALPLADQGALELGECAHNRKHQIGYLESSPEKARLSFPIILSSSLGS